MRSIGSSVPFGRTNAFADAALGGADPEPGRELGLPPCAQAPLVENPSTRGFTRLSAELTGLARRLEKAPCAGMHPELAGNETGPAREALRQL